MNPELFGSEDKPGIGAKSILRNYLLVQHLPEQASIACLPSCRSLTQRNIGFVACPHGHLYTMAVHPITRPMAATRVRHHSGTHLVQFDISQAAQEISVLLHQTRFVAPFKQGTAARVTEIEISHIQPTEKLKQSGYPPLLVGLLWHFTLTP